jgi:MerR-like DNA binding protein
MVAEVLECYCELLASTNRRVEAAAMNLCSRSQGEIPMYFPAEHLCDKLQISAEELSRFEQKGVVKGSAKIGRVLYSSQDFYRLKGILLLMSRGATLEEAQSRVGHPSTDNCAAIREES